MLSLRHSGRCKSISTKDTETTTKIKQRLSSCNYASRLEELELLRLSYAISSSFLGLTRTLYATLAELRLFAVVVSSLRRTRDEADVEGLEERVGRIDQLSLLCVYVCVYMFEGGRGVLILFCIMILSFFDARTVVDEKSYQRMCSLLADLSSASGSGRAAILTDFIMVKKNCLPSLNLL